MIAWTTTVHKFNTCLYEYRVRMEHDEDCESPLDKSSALSQVVEYRRTKPDFAYVESGKHNPELRETVFWREVWSRSDCHYLYVNLSEALEKWVEFMYTKGTPFERVHDHPGRWNLVEWIKANLKADSEVFHMWVEGDVYGFIVERRPLKEEGSTVTHAWEDADSIWGFYGSDWEKNGMHDYLGEHSYHLQDWEEYQALSYAPNM